MSSRAFESSLDALASPQAPEGGASSPEPLHAGFASPISASGRARPQAAQAFFLSRSAENDALLEHLRDMRWFARSRGHAADGQAEGPRFGALSELSERAPIYLFDHPELARLGPAFTDGRHVFLDARAAAEEMRAEPAGDPLMTLYARALALIAGLDPLSAPEIARQADKLAEPRASVAWVAPELVARALERSGLGPVQAALLYPRSETARGLSRLEPLPPGALPRASALILRSALAFEAIARPPKAPKPAA